MGVEHRMRQKGTGTAQGGGDQGLSTGFQRFHGGQGLALSGEQAPQQGDVGTRGGFVQRDGDVLFKVNSHVSAHGYCASSYRFGSGTGLDGQCVKRRFAGGHMAQGAQARGQDGGESGYTLGNAGQARRAVVHGVHAGHHRRQHLRGADVGGSFFAADVLLAGLQGQAVGGVAVHIHAHTYQAARHGALVFIAAGHVGGVRAAIAQRHAEALGSADDDVGIPLAGWGQQSQRQQVSRHDKSRLLAMHGGYICTQVINAAAGGGVLGQHGEVVASECSVPLGSRVSQLHGDAQRLGAGLDDLNGLRMAVAGHHKGVAFALDRAFGQRHRLSGGCGFVQHGGVGHRHAGQVAHHGLEVHQRFHAALADLGLVGRVSGVPGGVFEDVA